MNDYERKVLANVENFGWHCTGVFPAKGEEAARFSYTVGLFHSYRQPEFIIFGLDAGVAHSILSILANAAASGEMYPLDRPCGDLVQGYACMFVEVPKRRYDEYVFSALWYHAGDAFPLYQVVWPDTQGRYPWHTAYASDFGHEQPVLGTHEA